MNKRKGLREETKELYASLGRSLFLCFVALFAIVTATVAWFASNTNVQSSNTPVSANDDTRFYLATKARDQQGIYDDSQVNSNLQEALRYFKRIKDQETVGGLPQFQIGTTTITGSDNIEYIVGDADNISLRVNSKSNVNNTAQNDYVGPGSKGEITFYIIPNVAGQNQVSVTVSLAAYGLLEPNNGEVTAQLVNNSQLSKILCGHMLLFQGKDEHGNYVNQIEPTLGEDGSIRFIFTKEDNWAVNLPIEITLYWIWPYRFENLIYPGQPNSVFKTSGDAQTGFLNWVNHHEDYIVYPSAELADAGAEMSNSDFAKWSSGYNRGDQLIGDNVAYFVLTIQAEEQQ
ncbi:MAG: hypothetical protein ACI32B_07205 [Erysipelotrichaceae bacterium]